MSYTPAEIAPVELTLPASAASSTLKSEFSARRAALREVQLRNPHGKLAGKAGVLMLDIDAFEDRVKEAGGDDAFLYFITAQVASGVSLRTICDHYALEYGLLWAWMGAQAERLARYEVALKGLADHYVAEVVAISDEQALAVSKQGIEFDPDVARDKLRVDARMKVAGVLDRKRFGTEKLSAGSGSVGNVIDAALTFAAAELLNRIARPAERVVSEQ